MGDGIPVLAIHGTDGGFDQGLAEGIDGAELLITPDGGHVWINRADEVEAAVAAFLERVLPRQ